MVWQLHKQLAQDARVVGDFPLSRLLIMNDRQYPWFVLVPRVESIREIYELGAMEQQQLLQESSRLSMYLMSRFDGDKLNVAALGNMVPQLHLHHIVRFESDPAWPQPIWGKHAMEPYADSDLQQRCESVAEGLKLQPAISSNI